MDVPDIHPSPLHASHHGIDHLLGTHFPHVHMRRVPVIFKHVFPPRSGIRQDMRPIYITNSLLENIIRQLLFRQRGRWLALIWFL